MFLQNCRSSVKWYSRLSQFEGDVTWVYCMYICRCQNPISDIGPLMLDFSLAWQMWHNTVFDQPMHALDICPAKLFNGRMKTY